LAPCGACAMPRTTAPYPKVGLNHARCILAAAASEPPVLLLYSLRTVEHPVISPELAHSVGALQFCEGPNNLEVVSRSMPSRTPVRTASRQLRSTTAYTTDKPTVPWHPLGQTSSMARNLFSCELNICLTQSPAVTGTVTHDDALGERHFSDRIIGGRRCNRSLLEQLARRYCPYTRVYSSRH
jgi:hypothetical protein